MRSSSYMNLWSCELAISRDKSKTWNRKWNRKLPLLKSRGPLITGFCEVTWQIKYITCITATQLTATKPGVCDLPEGASAHKIILLFDHVVLRDHYKLISCLHHYNTCGYQTCQVGYVQWRTSSQKSHGYLITNCFEVTWHIKYVIHWANSIKHGKVVTY